MKTVVNLHPEELIERRARGELTSSEQARLDAHLAQCATCRFELTLRDDFADELAADVTPSETLSLAGVAQPRTSSPRAPRAPSSPPPEEAPVAPVRLPARRRSPKVAWLLVAAAVLAVSAASATGTVRHVWSQFVAPQADAPVSEAPLAAAPAKRPAAHRVWKSGEAAVVAPVVEAKPLDTVAAAAPPVVAVRPRVVEGPGALFDGANQARRRGDYDRALTLARDLQARFPASREAHVARATTARLLLDRGDPGGALADFDAYLAHGSGDLGEEAMVGRATALERLGRTAEAGRAWQALLAAYPDSPYTAHAQVRLGSLSVR